MVRTVDNNIVGRDILGLGRVTYLEALMHACQSSTSCGTGSLKNRIQAVCFNIHCSFFESFNLSNVSEFF